MALKIVIGRAGSGKTNFCLHEIRDELRTAPMGSPLILLTPEQATFQMEYQLLKESELTGMLRAQALSFRRLSFRVMQETGGTAFIPITDTGKHMLLYKLVHRFSEDLQLFKNSEDQSGFIERLLEMFTEWKRYGITPDQMDEFLSHDLQQNSPILKRKLSDMSILYRHMERELTGKYIDGEDYLSHLVNGIGHASSMEGYKIWIDGFYGFTPVEFEAIGAIMATAADVTITLTLDKHYDIDQNIDELDLFHPCAVTYQKLLQLAQLHGIEVEKMQISQDSAQSRFKNNEILQFLEQHYGQRTKYSGNEYQRLSEEGKGITIKSASNRRAEVEAVARDILEKVHTHHYRYRDMAILVRNTAGYSDYLELVFKDYNIPYFMDQKEKAVYHPLVEFIRSALETVLHGWQYDAIFRCIKTELLFPFDQSIPREWFDILENYVLATGIDGWKWRDATQWRALASVSLDEEDENAYFVSEQSKQQLEIVLAAREAVISVLNDFSNKLTKAKTVQDMCIALYDLLEKTRAADRLERWSNIEMEKGNLRSSRNHLQLWGNVIGLLDELVELVGEESVSPQLFMGMVEAGLDSFKLASIPPAIDQVLIGSMERTRVAGIKVNYILGASDGVMPMRIQEDGILSEKDREELTDRGITMAPSAKRRLLDERFLIYNALTNASDHLYISFPLADEEGKTILPSEIIRNLLYQFPPLSIQQTTVEPANFLSEEEQRDFIAHPERSLTYLISILRQWKQGEKISNIWWDLYNWYAVRPEWQHKLQSLTRSLQYTNVEMPIPLSTASKLYGEKMMMSVSRVERFVACPFQHFSIYGLRLRERKLYRLEAPDMGQLFHAALGKLATDLGPRWGRMSQTEIKKEANAIVESLTPRLQSQILLSSERFKYIAQKLKEIVANTAIVLGEHAARAEFVPIGSEIDFGPSGKLPSLVLPLENGAVVEIIGRIDRIDGADTANGYLIRVIDYKSSSTGLKLDEVIHGLSLQMLTYMDVLMTHGEQWLNKEVSPAGVLYYHVHNPMLSLKNSAGKEEIESLLMKRFKSKGLVTADAEVVRCMDNQLETGYSEIIPVGLKKDESFYSNASVVSREQWKTLQQFVRSKISQVGTSIQQGEVSIAPYQLGDRSPCQFCDYKAVCQFDPTLEHNQYRKLVKPAKEEIWNKLEG